ncbi:hypothetical protein ACH0BF_16265 [Pseudobacillus sp. 179-B 2D1 NHS]|uniref:hypothetical protein n=1 Tax=Pseudobacillus sp. 179-B 2D1 NHS TaxID=3374292 RepID=UPI00387994F7
MVKIVSFFVLFIILFLNVPLIGEAKTTGYSSSKGSNTAIKSPAQKSNGSKNKSTNQSNNSTNKTNSNKNNTSFPTTLLTAAGVYLLLDSITDDGEPVYINSDTHEPVKYDNDIQSLVNDSASKENKLQDDTITLPSMIMDVLKKVGGVVVVFLFATSGIFFIQNGFRH